MGAGQDIKQGSAWIRSQKGSLRSKNVPNQHLAPKKAKTQKNRDAKPRQIPPEPWGHDAHGGKFFFLGH